jgi:hypothetical protein
MKLERPFLENLSPLPAQKTWSCLTLRAKGEEDRPCDVSAPARVATISPMKGFCLSYSSLCLLPPLWLTVLGATGQDKEGQGPSSGLQGT